MHLRQAHSIVGLCAGLLWVASPCAAQEKCLACHPLETAHFLGSPMGRSIGGPRSLPEGAIRHALSGSTVSIQMRGSTMQHTVRRGNTSASYPVAYSVGAGQVGFSFLIRVGDYLFQSPASYYSRDRKWDLTPGYENERQLDFTHEITEGCLFCHAGTVKLAPGTQDRLTDPILSSISCERCHGPSEDHLKKPAPGTIVNPARLSAKLRDSVCEQCHLEGATRVLNPGRDWFDFHAGEQLEEVFATYVRTFAGPTRATPAAVSQSEQLAQSACARSSEGKLWCGTCHDAHGPDKNPQQIQAVCLGCHQAGLTKAHAALHAEPSGECISCHMPKLRPSDVAHTAITNHRIPRWPEAVSRKPAPVPKELSAWRDPDRSLVSRDLALAYFETAVEDKDVRELERGYNLLSHLPASQLHSDPATLAALGSILLEQKRATLAVQLLNEAVKLKPENPRYAYSLALALQAKGDSTAAVHELRRSIALDPAIPDSYLKLAEIYKNIGNEDLRESVIREYLRFMPQNLSLRGN